ncbi:MAG TPA: hypothetical protein DCS82_02255 [Rhodospirillaceae bacterium]|nr:hypothetical protein [Rhodospirillaceae bacterium]HAT34511.1 hypothetical protein [Rhodospirillaceae bacterium]
MAGEKIKVEFEIPADSKAFLEKMVDEYDLPDISKALRCLLDFAEEDGDLEEIFEEIRCRRC